MRRKDLIRVGGNSDAVHDRSLTLAGKFSHFLEPQPKERRGAWPVPALALVASPNAPAQSALSRFAAALAPGPSHCDGEFLQAVPNINLQSPRLAARNLPNPPRQLAAVWRLPTSKNSSPAWVT